MKKTIVSFAVVVSGIPTQALSQEQVTHPCSRFDVAQGAKITQQPNGEWEVQITDPSKIDTRILPHYRPAPGTEAARENRLSDLALLHLSYGTPQRIIWWLQGRRDKIDRTRVDQPENVACAQFLFGPQAKEHDRVYGTGPDAWHPSEDEKLTVLRMPLPRARRLELLNELETGALRLEGDQNPIRVKAFVEMMVEVLQQAVSETGITPRIGEHHRWSRDLSTSEMLTYFPLLSVSKLLVALSRGETSRHMPTGLEDGLRAWILEQPNESIWPHEMFKQAYALAQGDVYETLLTIENVLSRDWLSPDRENIATNRKLHPMSNLFGKGVKFGTWYHFFGIMLYGYVTNNEATVRFVGRTETVGRHILSRRDNRRKDQRQEDYVNRYGGVIGARLRKLVESGDWKDQAGDSNRLSPSSYLNLGEDFRPALQRRFQGEISEYLRSHPTLEGIQETKMSLLAARWGDLEMLKKALSEGEPLEARNRIGQTALHIAIWQNRMEIVDWLLAHGADVNAQDIDQYTPLMAALHTRNQKLIQLLRSRPDLDVSARNSHEQTAEDLARQLGVKLPPR